jgi:inner membrane protein
VDIITHVVAGGLAGGCVALLIRGAPARVGAALSWGALGGFLPDIDAASRVPGFDATVGRLLDLAPGSEIYGGGEWYSHHHFTHSLVAAVAAALLVAGLMGLERLVFGTASDGRRRIRIVMAPAALLAGFLLHLAGDLVTPASVWGGVQLLWPLDVMVGGWGWTWWFNNYDVFLLQVSGLGVLGLVSLVPGTRPVLARLLPAVLLACVLLGSTILLQLRQQDYAYTGHAPDYSGLEQASLDEQQRLLPADLYALMISFDQAMPLPF